MINKELIKRILSSLALLPVALFFIIKGGFFFIFFISICFLITLYEWHNMSKNKSYYLSGFLFLILSFYSAYVIRIEAISGLEYFIIILLICISTDLGGYIFGKIFKGPKLTKISPKKTYSGVIGGYLLAVIFLNLFFKSDYYFYPKEMTIYILVFILLTSTVSQLGDITISYFKRLSKIKDTGKIIPGHGGLLDRIDGMIFVFPFCYGIYSYFN